MSDSALPSPPRRDGARTRERILDAAERLFAERGVAGVSLRAIIAEAGVNLASVHYHFGSKDALVNAVVGRYAGPINEQRLARLEELERRYRGRPAPLRRLVAAFVDPVFERAADPDHGRAFTRLMGRLLAEPEYFFSRIAPEQFQAVRDRFLAAFRRALPQLSAAELFWRLMLMVGTLAGALRMGEFGPELSDGRVPPAMPDQMRLRLLDFLTAGLRAKVSKGVKP